MKKILFAYVCGFAHLVAFEAALDLGVRQDALRWTIGVKNQIPNILSELTWKNIISLNAGLAAHQMVYKNVGANLAFSAGKIVYGQVWDRDWWGQNKTALFSISNSDANKGHVLDLEGDLRVYWVIGSGVISEFFGFGYHRLKLTMLKGWQINYQSEGIKKGMPDLDSYYLAQFYGPYFGLNYSLPLYSFRTNLAYSYTWVLYRGTGFWNLRTDFSDNFDHAAKKGFGHTWNIDIQYPLSDNLKAGLFFLGRYFKSRSGVDTTYFYEDGAEYYSTMNLNSVRWVNLSLFAYITYQFGSEERRPSVRERLQRVFPRL